MEILSITHNSSNRILIVIHLLGTDEKRKKSEFKRLKETDLKNYRYDVEGDISSGFCNVIITLQGRTKAEIQEECCKLHSMLHMYMAEDYGIE